MINFLKDWLSGNTDKVSSKRGTGLVALLLVFIMGVAHTFGIDINSDIYLGTVALTAAALGLTLWNFKK